MLDSIQGFTFYTSFKCVRNYVLRKCLQVKRDPGDQVFLTKSLVFLCSCLLVKSACLDNSVVFISGSSASNFELKRFSLLFNCWTILVSVRVQNNGDFVQSDVNDRILAPCSQSFSNLGSRSGSCFKMNNVWTISHYLLKKT